MTELARPFTEYGIAGLILLVLAGLLLFGARGFRWFGKEMLIPMRDRHFEFMDRTEKAQTAFADALRGLAADLHAHGETLADVKATVDVLARQAERIEDGMGRDKGGR